MRSALVLSAGLAASAALYAVSTASDGLLGAATFLLALACIPVAVGFAVELLLEQRENRHSTPPVVETTSGPHSVCGCGRTRLEVHGVLLCPMCDAVGSDSP